MKRNLLPLALAILFLIPFAGADLALAPIDMIYPASGTILLIPIVLIEGIIAHFTIKKFFGFKFGIKYALLAFLAANIISSVVGVLIVPLIYISSISILGMVWLMGIPAYFLTSLIETPVIYLFIKSKADRALAKSLKLSFFVNIFSYLLIFAILTMTDSVF